MYLLDVSSAQLGWHVLRELTICPELDSVWHPISPIFFSNLQDIFKMVQRFILWNLKDIRLLLFEKCQFLKFNWTRFLFYQSNFCQIRTWPSLYNIQASCQISLKSVENFLSYLDHGITNKQNHKQNHRLTRVKQYLSPKQSLGRGNYCLKPWFMHTTSKGDSPIAMAFRVSTRTAPRGRLVSRHLLRAANPVNCVRCGSCIFFSNLT